MMILYVCLLALAFANPLEDENAMLKKANKALRETLKDLASGIDAEAAVSDWDSLDGNDGAFDFDSEDHSGWDSAEEQVAEDDGGCYNRCRQTGASFDECHKNCPFPGEAEVGDSACYNRCRQAGGSYSECTNNCGSAEEEEVGGGDACRDTNKVGHGRSMSPGQICDTRWDHVSYWRARHEYCRNDKGYWGCQYGYKRSGWNDYCCGAWERRNTNRCRCN